MSNLGGFSSLFINACEQVILHKIGHHVSVYYPVSYDTKKKLHIIECVINIDGPIEDKIFYLTDDEIAEQLRNNMEETCVN